MAILWATGKDTDKRWVDGGYVETPRPTYAGAVVGETGRDVRIMSDVWSWVTYAEVWDGTKVTEVPVSYSDYSGVDGTIEVDATTEVLAAVAAYRAAEAVKAKAELARIAAYEAKAEALRVAKGKMVVVARGRKVKKGTTGEVIWVGEGHWGWRVGVKDAAGEVYWTAMSNVSVALPVAA